MRKFKIIRPINDDSLGTFMNVWIIIGLSLFLSAIYCDLRFGDKSLLLLLVPWTLVGILSIMISRDSNKNVYLEEVK